MLKPIDVVFFLHLTIVTCMSIYPFFDIPKPYALKTFSERQTFLHEVLSNCEAYQQNRENILNSLKKGNRNKYMNRQEWSDILLCFDKKLGIIKEDGKLDIKGARNYYSTEYNKNTAEKMDECLIDKEYPEQTAESLYKCQVKKLKRIGVF
ncbi:unnamed protein product [Brassicogethes aeneus]|uniref:Uncharacterized protein n=1 Tax=Brassicogethes aeneus TaxID=1431903 RepID=A0A9P0ATT9_BRAAE|nr:unnamed protein product [Brassicogethes aeneus]